MANAKGEATAAYMRDYYRAHSTHAPMIPGADRQSKKCGKCGELKTRDQFTVRKSGDRIGHLSSYCRACNHAYHKQRKVDDPTIYRRIEWPSKLKKLYGITVADYRHMLAAQGGGCAVCASKDPLAGNRSYTKGTRDVFDVDHDHLTGKVRGLLCSRCNRLVGLAKDSADIARKLVKYLSKGA